MNTTAAQQTCRAAYIAAMAEAQAALNASPESLTHQQALQASLHEIQARDTRIAQVWDTYRPRIAARESTLRRAAYALLLRSKALQAALTREFPEF